MKKLGVGVLGVGEMGRRHAENLRRLVPSAQLVAVADVAEDRARQAAQDLEIENAFGSLEGLLGCKGIDAIVIATPDKFHPQVVKTAAAAGKHLLCEKPLALNLSEAQEALAAVAKAGVFFQVGFMRRYDPAYASAMKRIEAGEIGTPVIFKSLGRDKDGPPAFASLSCGAAPPERSSLSISSSRNIGHLRRVFALMVIGRAISVHARGRDRAAKRRRP